MTYPKSVKMTKDGGRYYRARTVFLISVAIMLFPVLIITVVALLNPFWFRDDLLVFVQNKIEDFSQWRNRLVYRVYLGTDPKVWHALKDDNTTKVGTDGS